jgi:DNA-directed RNA polymerase subunit RPC12/RpoP
MKPKIYGARPVIEMACPICGDSAKNLHRKRGNLFLNNMFYVCFNCGERMGYLKLLERFGFIKLVEEKTKNRIRHKPVIAIDSLIIEFLSKFKIN